MWFIHCGLLSHYLHYFQVALTCLHSHSGGLQQSFTFPFRNLTHSICALKQSSEVMPKQDQAVLQNGVIYLGLKYNVPIMKLAATIKMDPALSSSVSVNYSCHLDHNKLLFPHSYITWTTGESFNCRSPGLLLSPAIVDHKKHVSICKFCTGKSLLLTNTCLPRPTPSPTPKCFIWLPWETFF